MKKYLEVFRLSFKMQIVWRFDVAMTAAATAGRILAAWILWSAIFAGRQRVGGFTFEAMLSYYIVSSFLTSLDMSGQISGEISDLIRGGRFSGHMVVPIDPLAFFGAMTAGESAFHLGFSLAAALICMFACGIRLSVAAGAPQVFLAIAMTLLGLAFMACLQYLIGIAAFRFQNIDFLLHVQANIFAFATGALVPLSLLPHAALFALELLPFPYVAYLPAMLLTGQAGVAAGVRGLAVIAVWAAAAAVAGPLVYNRLRVRYDGVGI